MPKITNIHEFFLKSDGEGWQSYTPTFDNMGTVTGIDMWWRKNDNMIEVIGRFTTGTVAAGVARIYLPNSLVAQITGLYNTSSKINGEWQRANATASTRKRGTTLQGNGQSFVTFSSDDYTTAASPATNQNANSIFGSSENVYIKFSTVIEGW